MRVKSRSPPSVKVTEQPAVRIQFGVPRNQRPASKDYYFDRLSIAKMKLQQAQRELSTIETRPVQQFARSQPRQHFLLSMIEFLEKEVAKQYSNYQVCRSSGLVNDYHAEVVVPNSDRLVIVIPKARLDYTLSEHDQFQKPLTDGLHATQEISHGDEASCMEILNRSQSPFDHTLDFVRFGSEDEETIVTV